MTDNYRKLIKKNAEGYPISVNNEVTRTYQYGEELAILRKEIHFIEQSLNIIPNKEFNDYYNAVESIKENIKKEIGE